MEGRDRAHVTGLVIWLVVVHCAGCDMAHCGSLELNLNTGESRNVIFGKSSIISVSSFASL